MALTNNLITPPTVTTTAGGQRKKYTVTAADMVALGAYTTGIVVLDTLPAGAILNLSRIKHSVAVGIATSLSARLYFAADVGAGALDVFAAIGTTIGTHEISSVTPLKGLISGTNQLQVKFTNGGANLSTVTAGSIDVWVDWTNLY